MISFIFKNTFILISISIFLNCSKEEDASPGNIKSTTNTGSNQNTTSPASNNSSESNGDTGPTNPINEDFKCGNGFYYSSNRNLIMKIILIGIMNMFGNLTQRFV